MRKSSPFVSIPTVPSTISGQWLTFSHMANHYRKLLNVKPRVETFAPKSQHNLSPAPKPSGKRKVLRKRDSTKTREDPFKSDPNLPPPRRASSIIEFEYQLLSKAMEKEKTVKKKAPRKKSVLSQSTNEYQLIFGESQLNNLSEVVMSDSEVEDPLHNQMGVSEKIRLYLDQIQESESSISSPQTPTPRRKYSGGAQADRKVVRSQEEVHDAYQARHSNCFVPFVQKPETPRMQPKPKTANTVIKPLKAQQVPTNKQTKSDNCISAPKPKKIVAPAKAKHNPQPIITPKLKKNTRCKTLDELLQSGMKKVRKVEKVALGDNNSPLSDSGSIGTVRGSEELTEEHLMPLLSPSLEALLTRASRKQEVSTKKMSQQVGLRKDEQINSEWLKEKTEKGVVRINNAYFQLGSNVSKSSLSTLGYLNNKDSSRDSAYGFSSGESRITTRESTPEKIGASSRKNGTTGNRSRKWQLEDRGSASKYKSSLSTVASSINQDIPIAQTNIHHFDSGTDKNIPRCRSSRGSNWSTENKYINFLTAVTDDIVSRGIYTNKGLKSLFHSHIEKNKDLEMDKMTYMLDRLRMDVGIPKDDLLNNLEFGYGSVKYSSGPFFFKSESALLSHDYKDKRQSKDRPKTSGSGSICEAVPIPSKSRTSDLTIFELHRQDFHSGDESSKMSSCNTSELNGVSGEVRQDLFDEGHGLHNMSGGSSQSSKSSGLSLTESEVRNALLEVGFDQETTLDLVQIVRHPNPKRQETNNNKVERRNYSAAFLSEPNIVAHRTKGSPESL